MHENPVVLITGASRGIGNDVAVTLLDKGHRVVAAMRGTADRNAEACRALVDRGARVVDMDVTDDLSVERSVQEALAHYGRIDVLVNNAGQGVFGAMESATVADLLHQLDVNVLGPQRLLRGVLPAMRAQGSGLVIQMSSGMGRYVLPSRGPYAMSKWALEAMSDTYRVELAPFDVDVVILELGPFRSSFQEARALTSDRDRHAQFPHVARTTDRGDSSRGAGWDRFGDPAVVAQAVEELIARASGTRPWRLVLHPLRELLDPYNSHLEKLQRQVLESRGDPEPLPGGSTGWSPLPPAR
jgi:NAD(P)-dependent dehydrogenase (short-subunit alcohol dehydrogenase family)